MGWREEGLDWRVREHGGEFGRLIRISYAG